MADDPVDPLRVLLADEDRALEFATRARYEAARRRITAVLPAWEDASEYLKKAWRDETPKVVGPVLAALRKEAETVADDVHRFTVTVSGCTWEQAVRVMAERVHVDEDYGFAYRIDLAQDRGRLSPEARAGRS